MSELLTATDLDLKLHKSGPFNKVWSASQYVEPLRDGQPWCDYACAEDMLIQSARAAMRGQTAIKPTMYKLIKDEEASTLSLELG